MPKLAVLGFESLAGHLSPSTGITSRSWHPGGVNAACLDGSVALGAILPRDKPLPAFGASG